MERAEMSTTETCPVCNVLLIGKTGSGKTSFAKYLFGNESSAPEFVTGDGGPQTRQDFQHQVFAHESMGVRVFDTVGLEPSTYEAWRPRIDTFISNPIRARDADAGSAQPAAAQVAHVAFGASRALMDCVWPGGLPATGPVAPHELLHGVFYVMNAASGRVEAVEMEIIESVRRKVPVQVVLTNCDLAGQDKIGGIVEALNKRLADTSVHQVCSVAKRLRNGTEIAPFGQEEVMERFLTNSYNHIGKRLAIEAIRQMRALLSRTQADLIDRIERSGISVFTLDQLESALPDLDSILPCDPDFETMFPELHAYRGFLDSFGVQYQGHDALERMSEGLEAALGELSIPTIARMERIQQDMESGNLFEKGIAILKVGYTVLTIKSRIKDAIRECFSQIEMSLSRMENDLKS